MRDPPFIRISRSDPAVNAWRWYSHNLQFCWIFPICDASLTCLGVTILYKKIRGNLKNFAIQLGDQGGRGEECSKVAQSPPSNLCVCNVASVTSSPQGMTSWSSSMKIWISQSYRMQCHGVKQNAKKCAIGEKKCYEILNLYLRKTEN